MIFYENIDCKKANSLLMVTLKYENKHVALLEMNKFHTSKGLRALFLTDNNIAEIQTVHLWTVTLLIGYLVHQNLLIVNIIL